ncbi:unnamed protein product [Trifolium pratense]|uniref:Uncharacterized protein n=1 Tax=Trifolium pratense TaxID=57577 RepID=A0ACB0K6V5_TRIPR|nr:unnamed protein product [Trifolium pratense]
MSFMFHRLSSPPQLSSSRDTNRSAIFFIATQNSTSRDTRNTAPSDSNPDSAFQTRFRSFLSFFYEDNAAARFGTSSTFQI